MKTGRYTGQSFFYAKKFPWKFDRVESLLRKRFQCCGTYFWRLIHQYPYFSKMKDKNVSWTCRYFFIDQAFPSEDNDSINKIQKIKN